jgi:outer membrane protein assembly factor BamB/tetratricopeptide (TPR) repeat protein
MSVHRGAEAGRAPSGSDQAASPPGPRTRGSPGGPPRKGGPVNPFALGVLLWLSASLGLSSQEDPQQANTARIWAYPERDQLVARATSLAEQGRYAEALEIYETALRRWPLTVVPLDRIRSVGVRDYVQERIASWPPEAQALYRQRMDPQAEHLFQGARRGQDVEALERLADQFPASTYAAEALALGANLRLDSGENDKAMAALARLLEIEGGAAREVTVARLGLAYSRAGRRSALEALLERAERELAPARVRVGGREVGLLEHLRGLLSRTREAKAAPALELPAWEMMGGASSGSKLSEPGVELAHQIAWTDLVGLPRFEAEEDLGFRRGPSLAQTADFRPLFPAVSDGILYVHNGLSLIAYNLFSKSPERLWQFRVPPPQGEIMFDNRVVYAVTVHDSRVYANLVTGAGSAEDQLGYVRVKFPFPRRAIFCLDATTGLLLWKLGGVAKSEVPEEASTFAVPPTPENGRLYVGAVRQKHSTDPFEHHVLCLDPETGRTIWSTYVASGGTEINLFGNSTRESLGSPCAVTEDTVYYCTNHGVIAALEKKTGRPRWTYQYRQLPVNPTRSVYVTKNRLEWVSAPPLVSGDTVAVTPTDSYLLYALDARTGELRWERPRGREVRAILGAREGAIALGGERVEILDLKTGESRGVPAGDELQGSGRGAAASDGLYIPCRDKLRRLNWDGTWDEARSRAWPGGISEGGNLLVVDGTVILATQDTLQVYFDRRDQERAVRAELAKDPDNPVTLCRAAVRFLQSGASGQAAALLRKAIERTASSPSPQDARLHRAASKRLFALEMETARAGPPDEAMPHLRAALDAAPDTTSRLEASIQLGRAWMQLRDDPRAVAEFQRLLLEHGDDVINGARVFDLARNAIDAILKAAGRGAYAKEEEGARKLLAESKREGTPDAFFRVFQSYPNSAAAEEALLQAARAQGRLERRDDEIATLRQALREYSDSPGAPETHAALVRALERQKHYASAGALLRRMARAFPDAEVGEGEARVRVRDWVERRLAGEAYARAAAEESLPSLSPPLKLVFEHTEKGYHDGAPLRVLGATPSSAANLLLMNHGAGIKALDLRKGAEAWHVPMNAGVELAAWVEDGLVLADQSAVTRVDPGSGHVDWRYTGPTRMRGFSVSGSFLFFLAPDPRNESASRIMALDAVRNTIVWSQGFEGTAASEVVPAGSAVVFTTIEPYRIQLFEAETGKRLLPDAPFTRSQNAQLIHASEDVLLLHSEARFLEAYDLPAGTLRWRANLQRMATRAVETGTREVVLVGTQRPPGGAEERAFMSVYNLKTGKIARMQDRMDLGDPRFMLLEGERAYVVSREGDRSIGVRAVGLADLSVEWTATLGERDSTLLPPVLTKDHLVLGYFEGGVDGKFAYGGALLDKAGRLVQNIKSGHQFERPPGFGVANGRLVFSVDNKVEVHR